MPIRFGDFMTSNMEGTGTLTVLNRLGRQRLIDSNPDREVLRRTVGSFTILPKRQSAEWIKPLPDPDGGKQAIEAAFLAGSFAFYVLLDMWADHHDRLSRAGDW